MNDQANEPTMDDILASIRRIIAEDDGEGSPKALAAEQSAQSESAQSEHGNMNEAAAGGDANMPAAADDQGGLQQAAFTLQAASPNMPASAANIAASASAIDDDEDDDEVLVLTTPAAKTSPQPEVKAEAPKQPEIQTKQRLSQTVDTDALPKIKPARKKNSLDGIGLDGIEDARVKKPTPPASMSSTMSSTMPSSSASSVMKPTPLKRAERGLEGAFSDERLLSATTESLGTAAFASLERAVRMGKAGDTLEDVVRNLLRPMLRGWIDQNLPALVERMVQAEIQKIVSGARRNWDDGDL
ncbi:MAG: DUF2497 domain-containing protein [Alphaproteobacteria bacterium]